MPFDQKEFQPSVSPGIRIDLFQILSRHLRTLPREKFDLATWSYTSLNGCQTTACAIGHAAELEEFKLAGLRVIRVKTNSFPTLKRNGVLYTQFYAVSVLFGIELGQAHYLFHFDHYRNVSRSPESVADRIDQFIQNSPEILVRIPNPKESRPCPAI